MKCIIVLEPRKFDAELSAVPVKRLNLSIVFLIGDIQVSVTSYILQNSPVVGFRNNVLTIRISLLTFFNNCVNMSILSNTSRCLIYYITV